jgi:hypothetical protein
MFLFLQLCNISIKIIRFVFLFYRGAFIQAMLNITILFAGMHKIFTVHSKDCLPKNSIPSYSFQV